MVPVEIMGESTAASYSRKTEEQEVLDRAVLAPLMEFES